MKHKTSLLCAALLTASVLIGCATTRVQMASDAEHAEHAEHAKLAELVMRQSFVTKGQASVDRLNQDEIQGLCTAHPDKQLPPALAARLQAEQLAAIVRPTSGNLLGDWRAGEKLAQEGRGLQFSDTPGGPVGGNCYACHQLTPTEISHGNIGPSLLKYGVIRGQSQEMLAYTYNKIFNSQAYQLCSSMPRFGHAKILTPEQIADLVALLLDPTSPVNQ